MRNKMPSEDKFHKRFFVAVRNRKLPKMLMNKMFQFDYYFILIMQKLFR